MINEGSIEWGEASITGSRQTMFKLDSNQTARISVLSSKALMIYDHYSQKARRHVRCIRSVGHCPACETLGEPKERFAARILVYGTDATGNLTKPLGFKLVVWVFSADKFVDLRNIQKEWGPLNKLDLNVSCSDKTFQKMTFTPAKECIWRKGSGPEIVKRMLKEQSVDLETVLGKILPPEEVSKRLGLDAEKGTLEESDLTSLEDVTFGEDTAVPPEDKGEVSDLSTEDAGGDLADIDAAIEGLDI